MTEPVAIAARAASDPGDTGPRGAVGAPDSSPVPAPTPRPAAQPINAFLKAIEPFFQDQPLTYVDVGAHRGDVLAAVVEKSPRLREALLIEPNPASFAGLEERVAALGLTDKVRCFNLALSDAPGRLRLRDGDDMTRVIDPADDEAAPGRIFEIEAATLDALAGELAKPRINLLKIDVEGFELAVLAGAKGLFAEQAIDMIYIEAGLNPESTQQTYYRDIEDALGAHGYRMFRIFEQKHEWLEDSPFLRRINLAFMSPRFAAAHPYNLCASLLTARKANAALKQDHAAAAASLAALRKEHDAASKQLHELGAENERLRRDLDQAAAAAATLRELADVLGREQAANAEELRRRAALVEQLTARLETAERAAAEASAGLAEERKKDAEARSKFDELHRYARGLEAKYADVLNSESWRITAPIRSIMRSLKGGKKPARFVPRLGPAKRGARAAKPLRAPKAASPEQVAEVRRYGHHLWGGLSRPAVRELERVLGDPAYAPDCRFDAAQKLATWHAFDGDLEAALRVIRAIDEVAPARRNARARLMKEGFIHLKRGDKAAARSAFERLLAQKGCERHPDATLALANCLPDDEARLAQINKVFVRAGRVGIERRDPSRPLTLGNIRGLPATCALPELGRVSVIMPTYASEDTLRMAIRSVQEQTYRNLEIIVVDDCSPDGTHAVAAELAETDERIIVIRQERNGGAYAARNRGLEAATGAFITTHDADDWSHPQKIERQLAFLDARPEVMGVCTHWARATTGLEITPNWRIGDPVIHWSHPSFLFRRAVLDRLGPWDPVRVGADTEYVWRLQAAFGKEAFHKIDARVPLAFAIDDASSLTRSKQTHVSTINYGLRQIYRAVARRSHVSPGGTGPEGAERRLAALPARLKGPLDAPIALDFMLMGNCCDEAIVAQMAAWLDGAEAAGKRVGIVHWPDFKAPPATLSLAYGGLLLDRGVIPVPPQTEVTLATRLGIFFGDCTVEPDSLPVFVPTPV